LLQSNRLDLSFELINLTREPQENTMSKIITTVEDALNEIEQNSAITHSALYDTNLFEIAQVGLQRLMHQNMTAVAQLRMTLTVTSLMLELVDDRAA
jgi:hypothetical protein